MKPLEHEYLCAYERYHQHNHEGRSVRNRTAIHSAPKSFVTRTHSTPLFTTRLSRAESRRLLPAGGGASIRRDCMKWEMSGWHWNAAAGWWTPKGLTART